MSYLAPAVRASGNTFANLKVGGLVDHLERLLAANAAGLVVGAAPTKVDTGGGTAGGALAPGNYLARYTLVNGVGETTASAETGTIAVARQSNPSTQATVAATGGGASGGLLAAGTYYLSYTFVDAVNAGETTAGTSESAQFTVSAGNKPRATLPALPAWAASMNVYLTAANGATGTEVLYATGVTTTTYDLLVAAPVSVVVPPANTTSTGIPRLTFPALPTGATARNVYVTAAGGAANSEVLYAAGVTATTYDLATANTGTVVPPGANTTGVSQFQADTLRRLYGNAVVRDALGLVASYLEGQPVAVTDEEQRLLDYATVFHLVATALDEVAVLVAANTGTLGPTTEPTGIPATVRTFP